MEQISLVCLVEDDPVHAFIAQKVIGMTGMVERVLIFGNGKEIYDYLVAQKEASEKLPDLILLDLNMPIWDGWQFLEEAKEVNLIPEVPLYIITSSTDRADRDRADQHTLSENYLVKPLTVDKLRPILEQVSKK